MERNPFLRIPAIRVSQPIGEFYLCAIPAEVLMKVAYSIPATLKREHGMFSSIFGTQRVESKARAKQIGAYIDELDSTFPNTIILSVNYREDGDYEDDELLQWKASKASDGCVFLTIPSAEKLASIIDGQHRLKGYEYVEKADRMTMDLPCAVYINLPRPYQAKIFATININQKRVDKSLAYELFGYDLSDSDADKWPPDMLGVYLARVLEGQEDSPFRDHVRLALVEEEEDLDDEEKDRWEVSVACLVEGVTRLISEKPKADRSALASGKVEDRSELSMDSAPLRRLYIDGKDKTLKNIVVTYFRLADELLWQGRRPGSFIIRTVGVLALFDLLREGVKAGKIDVGAKQAMEDSTRALLKKAKGIDFSDDYFHASGAGRVRIRNVLKIVTGLGADVEDASAKEAASRLSRRA